MAQTPTKPPNAPTPQSPPPVRGPTAADHAASKGDPPRAKTGLNDPLHGLSDQERRDRTQVSDDNPLKELAAKQREDQEARKERDEPDDRSLAERETLATGERLLRQREGVEGEHYLRSRADNDRAQIEERVEEQAAAKRHPVTGEAVVVTGVPPRADMQQELDDVDVDNPGIAASIREEMKAGREGLKSFSTRSQSEHDVGRRALQNHANQHPDEPDPRQIPPRQPPKAGHSEE